MRDYSLCGNWLLDNKCIARGRNTLEERQEK